MTTGKLLSAASEAVSRRLRRPKRNKDDDDFDAGDEEYLPRKKARAKHHHHHHHYHQPQTSSGRSPRKGGNRFSTDSETDTSEKRSLHNNMERMRRIDLRNLFEDLRSVVPCLTECSRAAKVTILKEAANYCYELTGIGMNLHNQVAVLRKQQEKLRANLSRLRRNLAARR
ncbi:hypothetical protein AAG570_013470 [Ranatra chinensis]|uniref:BHLH domain-containing protein n=1 Tax=Ranatra chinensis TaxID=642074 RepID=A0ABD0YC98_9HEMI